MLLADEVHVCEQIVLWTGLRRPVQHLVSRHLQAPPLQALSFNIAIVFPQ